VGLNSAGGDDGRRRSVTGTDVVIVADEGRPREVGLQLTALQRARDVGRCIGFRPHGHRRPHPPQHAPGDTVPDVDVGSRLRSWDLLIPETLRGRMRHLVTTTQVAVSQVVTTPAAVSYVRDVGVLP
jgi:hypothetical protein